MVTTAQAFYTDPAFAAHDQAYGTDIDKMLDADPGTTNYNSTCDFGSSGNKTITVDPNTAGRTTTGVSDAHGWAINNGGSDGMGSTSTAKRWIKAGTLSCFVNGQSSVAPLATVTAWVWVYRVAASPSFARTLLGSGSTAFGAGAPLASPASSTITVNIALSEVVLEAGETIQFSYGFNATGQAGGYVCRFRAGDSPSVPSPGIRTLGEGVGAATGTGTGTGVGGKVLGTVGAASGVGTATGALGATATTIGTAAGSSTVTGVLGATGSMTGTATGTATATGVGGLVLGTVGTVEIGSGAAPPSTSTVIFGIFD